ncbi:MAG TPA: methionine adenosyltransferase [Nannocystaceae bacterium]|nr:methionine adenosyltransferase [Nannocystaceae bacterium]
MARRLFTSESVTEGHPDKICDKVSDAILDAIIAKDPRCRVACETLVKTGYVNVAGEITTNTYVDIPQVVRKTIREIGYTSSAMGFDADSCGVLVAIEAQSADISLGVDGKGVYSDEQGAGDQGMMFGYACTETQELMPLPISLAHKLTRRLTYVRRRETDSFLRPDGKSQVTVEYEGHTPKRVDAVVVSTQHREDVSHGTLKEFIMEEVIKPMIPTSLLDAQTKYYVNPTGRFVIGGPMGDSGLTGRKIIVDTYGGMGRHGGGAFSGKDPSKVDRSAAYYARFIAKHVVAAGLADRCEVQLAYAIGVAKPMSVLVETFGTGKLPEDKLSEIVQKHFDARPGRLIAELDLLRPIYAQTAAYGHFGREEHDFSWERLPKLEALRAEK